MTYVITEACIGTKDQSCTEVCPVDCIIEATHMNVIDPTECIDCSACESACPVDAIIFEHVLPDSSREFLAINAAIRQGVPAVDAAVESRG